MCGILHGTFLWYKTIMLSLLIWNSDLTGYLYSCLPVWQLEGSYHAKSKAMCLDQCSQVHGKTGRKLRGPLNSTLILCTQNTPLQSERLLTQKVYLLLSGKKKSWDQLLFNIYPAPVMTATSTLLRYFSCLFCFVFAKEMELDGAGL